MMSGVVKFEPLGVFVRYFIFCDNKSLHCCCNVSGCNSTTCSQMTLKTGTTLIPWSYSRITSHSLRLFQTTTRNSPDYVQPRPGLHHFLCRVCKGIAPVGCWVGAQHQDLQRKGEIIKRVVCSASATPTPACVAPATQESLLS